MNSYTLTSLLLLALMAVGVALTFESHTVKGQDDELKVARTDVNGDPVGDPTLASTRLDKELVQEIELLASMTIDDTFFSNSAFMTLRDFGRPLPSYSVGRRDPFRLPSVEFAPSTNATSTR